MYIHRQTYRPRSRCDKLIDMIDLFLASATLFFLFLVDSMYRLVHQHLGTLPWFGIDIIRQITSSLLIFSITHLMKSPNKSTVSWAASLPPSGTALAPMHRTEHARSEVFLLPINYGHVAFLFSHQNNVLLGHKISCLSLCLCFHLYGGWVAGCGYTSTYGVAHPSPRYNTDFPA